jgi:hypothetical protein
MLLLDQILARLDGADQQSWHRHGADVRDGAGAVVFRGRDGGPEVREQADRDAELVAHCREDLRALLDEVRSLRAALEAGQVRDGGAPAS